MKRCIRKDGNRIEHIKKKLNCFGNQLFPGTGQGYLLELVDPDHMNEIK